MINWKEIPFVRFLLPFATGIVLSIFLENNHPIWYGSLIALAVVRLILAFRKIPYQYRLVHGILANGLLFLMGYLWCFHHNELQNPNHFQQYLEEENVVIAKVSNTPEIGGYVKARLEMQHIGNLKSDSLKPINGNLLIYLKNDSLRTLNYGDVIAIKSRIQKVDAPKNPFAFNYQRYLHFQNIHFQSFVNTPADWKIIKTNQGYFIQEKIIKLRQYFMGILEMHLRTTEELAVGKALVLGQKDDLNEELRTAYAHTGALHVLAVSGLHVGLVAWFVNVLLSLVKSRTWTWRISKTIILIGVVWSFALVTGGSPSVLRAATMFTFLIIGMAVNRATNIYNSLAISASFLLVWNPYLLFNVGFQLSYLAILGIVFFQPKIFRAWFIKNSIGRSAWKLATVSFGAQIGTLPLSLFYFHSFPLFAWLSGIIVIPAATIILGSGLLLLIFQTIIPAISFLPGTLLFWTIWVMNQLIFFIQKIPASVWVGVWIGVGVVFLMYGIIGSIVMVFNDKKYKWLLPAAGFFLLIAINYSFISFGENRQKKMVIYHSYKNTIVDFFDGKKGWSFSNENISEKNLSFPTKNNRWAHGVKKVTQLTVGETEIQSQNLFFQKPFIQFFDKKILLLDDTFQFKKNPKITLDFILIRNNPKVDIKTILEYFNFEKIIFDCSNSQWKVEKWKTECQNLNLKTHDIFKEGAFELKLE